MLGVGLLPAGLGQLLQVLELGTSVGARTADSGWFELADMPSPSMRALMIMFA